MTDQEWDHEHARSLGVYLSGAALNEIDRNGKKVRDDDCLVLFNAHHDDIEFSLPTATDAPWHALIDTAAEQDHPDARRAYAAGETFALQGRSLALLIRSASIE
jgi:glycogen operon protein